MQSCSYRSDYLIATFKIGFFSQLRCFNGKKKKKPEQHQLAMSHLRVFIMKTTKTCVNGLA